MKSIQVFMLVLFAWSAAAGPLRAESDYSALSGKWIRPDGGYVIEIRNVNPDGKMDARYFNPGSIHVARAEASQAKGEVEIYIELRDVNYPGSNYHLKYDPKKDILAGVYFQAVEKQAYDVYFQRLPKSEKASP